MKVNHQKVLAANFQSDKNTLNYLKICPKYFIVQFRAKNILIAIQKTHKHNEGKKGEVVITLLLISLAVLFQW